MKIPKTGIKLSEEIVATSLTFFPKTPKKVRLKMKYKTIGRIAGLGETTLFTIIGYAGISNLFTSQNLKSQLGYAAMTLLSIPGIASGIVDTLTGAHLYLVNRTARNLSRNQETRKRLDLDLERQLAKLEKTVFGN